MYRGVGIRVENHYYKAAKQLLLCFGMSEVVAFSSEKCGDWLSKIRLMESGTLYETYGFSHPNIIASAENSYYEKYLSVAIGEILSRGNSNSPLKMYCTENLYYVAKALFENVTLYSVYDYRNFLGYRKETIYSSAEEIICEFSFCNYVGMDFNKNKKIIEEEAMKRGITPSWTEDAYGCMVPDSDDFDDLVRHMYEVLTHDDRVTSSVRKNENKKVEQDLVEKLLDTATQQSFGELQQIVSHKFKV